jgi:serine/threonine protein kinase
VHEVTFDAGQDFIVMEYIDGRSLDELKLGARDAAALMADIADAVDYMHGSGVHPPRPQAAQHHRGRQGRRPSRRFRHRQGLRQRAAHARRRPDRHAAVHGARAGGRHAEQMGPRTDVYGLGATLYFCLVSRPPYGGESFEAVLGAIRTTDPAPPKTLDPAVPPELDIIVRRAMARSPAERYVSAAALRDDLRRFLRGEASLPGRTAWPERACAGFDATADSSPPRSLASVVPAVAFGVHSLRSQARQATYETIVERADRLWHGRRA